MGGGQTRDSGDPGTQPGQRGEGDQGLPTAEALIGCGVKDSHAIIAADDSLLREEKMHAKEMLPPRVDAWSFLHQ